MTKTTIKAVRTIRALTGLSLRKSTEQVRAIVSLAANDCLLPGDFYLECPRGHVLMSDIYFVIGVGK